MAARTGVRTACEVVVATQVEQGLADRRIVVVDRLVLAQPELVPKRLLDVGLGLLGRELDRLEIGDEVVDLLLVERAASFGAPCRHRREGPAVDDDVAHLLLGEAQQHRLQRRRLPVDRGDELVVLVSDRERRRATDGTLAVTACAVETTVGGGGEQLFAPAREALVPPLDRAVLAAGFGEPVQGKADGDDGHEAEGAEKGSVELAALELFVVEVGLAVGRDLDLRAGLGAAGADVDEHVDNEADRDQHRDDHADGLDRAGSQHDREQGHHRQSCPPSRSERSERVTTKAQCASPPPMQ